MNMFKFFGILFLLWGLGYMGAMNVTVKALPALPCWGFFIVGALLLGVGLSRDKRNK